MAAVTLKTRPVADPDAPFPKIDVLLNGRWFGQLHYRVKGYRGYLPAVPENDGAKPALLPVTEVPTGDALTRMVAKLNAEWASKGCR